MTYEEKINYLNSYLQIKSENKHLCEQIALLEEKKLKISTTSIIHVNKQNLQNTDSRQLLLMNELSILEKRLKKRIILYQTTLERIENIIDDLQEIRSQQLLRYRYIDGYTFQKIAIKMHYNDKSYVHKCHKKIIQNLNL